METPKQKRNFIALYIEMKLKHKAIDPNVNFHLSDILQTISQYRCADHAHDFIQYEREILQYFEALNDQTPDETLLLHLKERRII